MKLKLEKVSDITVLSVSEKIASKDVAVLKAGLGKIVQTGITAVLLDLTAIQESDLTEAGVSSELSSLEGWAKTQGAFLILAGTAGPLIAACRAPTREEGLKRFANSIDHLQVAHQKLAQKLQTLETMRDQLAQKMSSASGTADQVKNLRHENGELRTQIAELEQFLGEQTTGWVPPLPNQLLDKGGSALRIMESILKQEGILP